MDILTLPVAISFVGVMIALSTLIMKFIPQRMKLPDNAMTEDKCQAIHSDLKSDIAHDTATKEDLKVLKAEMVSSDKFDATIKGLHDKMDANQVANSQWLQNISQKLDKI